MSTALENPPVETTEERKVIDRVAAEIAGKDEEWEVEWPTAGDTPAEEFRMAEVAAEIGRELLEHIPRFDLLARNAEIRFVYRNKKDWRKDGKLRLGECKLLSGLNEYFAECKFVITINWRAWLQLNPWQRVALIYHELRHADADEDGKPFTNPHDFEVFADEIELFGLRTMSDWMKLGRAIDAGSEVSTQYDLPLLALVPDGAPEPAGVATGDSANDDEE